MKVLIFGQGYLGNFILSALGSRVEICGTHRTSHPGCWIFSEDRPLPTEAFEGVTHVVTTIPPLPAGDLVLRHHQKDLVSSPTLRWVGYVSSTSVYGDHEGRTVTEKSACHPQTINGRQRLRDEDAWRATKLPLTIFRLGGIYGPGRSVLDRLQGPKILAPEHPFSRIHVEDASRLIGAAMCKGDIGKLYNIVDQESVPTSELMDYACALKGLPPLPGVPLAKATLSPMLAAFYSERKRVNGGLILKDLKLNLLYPTYREGLLRLFEI